MWISFVCMVLANNELQIIGDQVCLTNGDLVDNDAVFHELVSSDPAVVFSIRSRKVLSALARSQSESDFDCDYPLFEAEYLDDYNEEKPTTCKIESTRSDDESNDAAPSIVTDHSNFISVKEICCDFVLDTSKLQPKVKEKLQTHESLTKSELTSFVHSLATQILFVIKKPGTDYLRSLCKALVTQFEASLSHKDEHGDVIGSGIGLLFAKLKNHIDYTCCYVTTKDEDKLNSILTDIKEAANTGNTQDVYGTLPSVISLYKNQKAKGFELLYKKWDFLIYQPTIFYFMELLYKVNIISNIREEYSTKTMNVLKAILQKKELMLSSYSSNYSFLLKLFSFFKETGINQLLKVLIFDLFYKTDDTADFHCY